MRSRTRIRRWCLDHTRHLRTLPRRRRLRRWAAYCGDIETPQGSRGAWVVLGLITLVILASFI